MLLKYLIIKNIMDIIPQLVSFHCDLDEIKSLRLLSKTTKQFIEECRYTHIRVEFDGDNVVELYQLFKCFQNIRCPNDISDYEIVYLNGCHILHLINCIYITDEGFLQLNRCKEIIIDRFTSISDEAISLSNNCHKVQKKKITFGNYDPFIYDADERR